MRSVDERVAAVRRRSARLRRRRSDRMLAVLVCIMVFPLVGLAGKVMTDALPAPAESTSGLFGAASLFGSSAGGYVLVAVLAAVIAAAVTAILMLHRRSRNAKDEDDENT